MACVSTAAAGNRRGLFTHPDGRRKAVYLGAVTKKQAEAVKLRVKALVAGITARLARDTAAGVDGVGDGLADNLPAGPATSKGPPSSSGPSATRRRRGTRRGPERTRTDEKPGTL